MSFSLSSHFSDRAKRLILGVGTLATVMTGTVGNARASEGPEGEYRGDYALHFAVEDEATGEDREMQVAIVSFKECKADIEQGISADDTCVYVKSATPEAKSELGLSAGDLAVSGLKAEGNNLTGGTLHASTMANGADVEVSGDKMEATKLWRTAEGRLEKVDPPIRVASATTTPPKAPGR